MANENDNTRSAPKRWTKEEDRILVENNTRKTAREIGAMVGRSVVAVRARAAQMGVRLEHGAPLGKPWSERERKHVMENYMFMTNRELAGDIGKREKAVERFLQRHHLRRQ